MAKSLESSRKKNLKKKTQSPPPSSFEGAWWSLVKHSPDWIAILDPQGVIRFANRSFEDRPIESLEGTSLFQSAFPEEPQFLKRNLKSVIENGKSFFWQKTGKCFQDKHLSYRLRLNPIWEYEQITEALLVVQKVGEKKQARQESPSSRQSPQERAHGDRVQAVAQMAAAFAHELNQPLTAIQNYAEGCLQRLSHEDFDPQDFIPPLKETSSQANRAHQIIQRIQRFLEKKEVQKVPFDLNQAVQNAIALMQPEIRKHGIELNCRLDRDLHFIAGDIIQIEQVLVNLIRNAIDALQESKKKIFKNFDSNTNRRYLRGTGLGSRQWLWNSA